MTAASGAAAPRVDRAVVGQLVTDLGAGPVVDVCDVFLADGRAGLDAIRSACASGDAGTAAGTAHRLKSASGFLGAPRVAALCAEIESLARDRRLNDVSGRVEEASEELEAAAQELSALVRSSGEAPAPPPP